MGVTYMNTTMNMNKNEHEPLYVHVHPFIDGH
jgi:hypothetical protein